VRHNKLEQMFLNYTVLSIANHMKSKYWVHLGQVVPETLNDLTRATRTGREMPLVEVSKQNYLYYSK